jgi:hypothetical protein
MINTETAFRRRIARRLRIVTELPVLLQQKPTRGEPDATTKPILVSLERGTLKITETATGEIVVEFEPP